MKILCVADEECKALYDYYVPGKLKEYDLILSSGDLKADYLSFLVTVGSAPVYYVHGNHDTGYDTRPPEGCDCIDDKLVVYNGLRILGLGGCRWYHEGKYQYTEAQMRRRIRKLRFKLWWLGGVDIVVTHAPAEGFGDMPDPAHKGFRAFLELMDKYKPMYLLHGHVHKNYGTKVETEHTYGETRLINVGERYVLDFPDALLPRTTKKGDKLDV